MSNPSNATSTATLKTAHTNAESGGVTFGTGAVPSVGNMGTTWSRSTARTAYGNGTINQTQFIEIMNALAVYEQTQNQAARDAEGSTGALPQ
jgi:hypothetical protein